MNVYRVFYTVARKEAVYSCHHLMKL